MGQLIYEVSILKRHVGQKIEIESLNQIEKPISSVYPVIDTDLARDNLENDLPAADLEDL